MGVILNPEGEHYKELQRWDTPKYLGGFAPDGFQEYPMMLYHAYPNENGAVMVGDPVGETSLDLSRVARAEAFTKRCQLKVFSESERATAERQGWRESPKEALAHYEAIQVEFGNAAAEEAYRVRRMSAKAQEELDAAARETHEHVAEVPVPKKRPGRKPKILTEAV